MALGGGDGSIILTTKIDESGLKSGLSTMKSGLATAGKAFTVIGAAAMTAFTSVGTAIIKGTKDVAAFGDEIDKNSQRMGLSTEAYQKWDYVLQISGSSIQNVQMGMKTLTNTLDDARKGTSSAVEKFERLGISMDDLEGKSREDVFMLTVKSLQNVEDSTLKAAMANDLFGRSGQEMLPLLNGSNESIDALMKQAEDYGFIMSNEAVEASAAFTDSLTTLSMTASGLKNKMMAEFLPSLTSVTDGLALLFTGDMSGLDRVNEGVSQLIGQVADALPKIIEIGGSIVQSIGGAIIENLPKLLNSGFMLMTQLASSIIGALPTLIQTIVEALPTILPTFINGTVQLIVLLASQLPNIIQPIIDNLPMIITAISGAVIENLPILINGAIQLVAGIVKAIPSIISALLQSIKGIAIQIGQALFNTLPQPVKDAFKNAWEGVKNVWSGVADWFKGVWSGIKDAFSATKDWFSDIFTKAKDGVKNAWGNVKEWFANIWQGIKDAFKSVDTFMSDKFGKAWDAIKRVWGVVVAYYQGIWNGIKFVFSVVKDVLSGNFSDAWEKIKSVWSNVKAFFVNVWNNIKSAFNFGDMLTIGRNIVQGLWNGIINAKDWLLNKIKSFATSITDGIKSFFGIHSPSTVMRDEVGKMIPRGIAVGIDQAKDYVTKAVKSLVEDTRSEYQRVIDDMNKKLLESEEKYAKESLRIEQEKEEREYQDKVKAAKTAEELEKIENERLLKIQEKQQAEYLNNLKETAEKERKLHDARQKDIENAQKKIVDAYDTASSEILSSISTLQKRQEDLANKLSDFGDIMEDVQTVEDKFSKIHNPLRESAAGNLYLDNLQAQTEELENYYETLASLRDREGMSSALFDVIKNMGYEESLTYTKRLLELSDHMFTEYVADWQKKQETTQRITDELFGDDEKVNPKRVLADISDQTNVLKDYYQILEDIKKRADVPQEFFETIRDMGIEEGLEYGTSLLELSDEDFQKYINDWKEKQNTAKQISKMLYKDEADELSSEIRNKFEEVEKSFFDIGSDSADLFENGFMEQLSNVVANIKSAVDSAFGNVSPYGKFSIKVPALAKGAVLPPNKEFLAVVGDQKSGTNVEAPLKTIEQAVQNVIGRGNFQTVKEEHYYLNETELMTILHKLVKGGERIQGNTLISGGAY